jgi:hypothetical protein
MDLNTGVSIRRVSWGAIICEPDRPGRPRSAYSRRDSAMTIPATTKTTIAVCVHNQKGDTLEILGRPSPEAIALSGRIAALVAGVAELRARLDALRAEAAQVEDLLTRLERSLGARRDQAAAAARRRAVELALAGRGRADVARALEAELEVADAAAILDDVFGSEA